MRRRDAFHRPRDTVKNRNRGPRPSESVQNGGVTAAVSHFQARDRPASDRAGEMAPVLLDTRPTPAATLAEVRAHLLDTTAPAGPIDSMVGEMVVHGADIRRPLGITFTPPARNGGAGGRVLSGVEPHRGRQGPHRRGRRRLSCPPAPGGAEDPRQLRDFSTSTNWA